MKLTMLKIMLLLTVIFMKIEVTEAVSCNQVSNDFSQFIYGILSERDKRNAQFYPCHP